MARIDHDGDTLYSGSLSPGCVLCKQGAWDCIFVTMRCNLRCTFCCSVSCRDERPQSAFGTTCEGIAECYDKAGIRGIAFTGGEPLLELETLVAWIAFFRRRFPDAYLWLYTNGTLATREAIARIAEARIDEIRFNMAASGYGNAAVISALESAAKRIGRVAVEIPCIPSDRDAVLESLARWVDAGVTHLNLHELIKEAGSNSEHLPGDSETLTLEDGHVTLIDSSSGNTILEIIGAAHKIVPSLSVNECSVRNKLRQIRGRRRNIGTIIREPFETVGNDGHLYSLFAWESADAYSFEMFAGDSSRVRPQPKCRKIIIKRRPPLRIHGSARWCGVADPDACSASALAH